MEVAVDKSALEDDLEEMPSGRKFRWKDRIGLVELLAQECADSGRKFDVVFSSTRITQFAFYASLIPGKQKTALKKEVLNRVKDILYSRESADIGDVVKVPRYKDNPLLGGYIRDGRKLVEAVIISKEIVASAYRYTVKRIDDGQLQKGNGHMIKAIVTKAAGSGQEIKE